METKECRAAVGEQTCVLPERHEGPHSTERPAPPCEHDWLYFHDGARCTRCGVMS